MKRKRALLIRGGRIICPASGRDEVGDVYVRDGLIVASGEGEAGREVEIDASGMIVCPGLIDIHVHLREPGAEHKETMETGTRSAVRGGFTTVCAMPNTSPAPDTAETVAAILTRVRQAAWCRVGIIGAATLGNDRSTLTDYAALADAGCIAVSDDAFMLRTREQRREALLRCADAGLRMIAHAEREELSAGGVMHAGEVARRLGLMGQHPEAEVRSLEDWRDAWDDDSTPPPLHIAHVSTAAGVEFLREWQAGPSAETAPHYLALTDEAVVEHGANAKMNPPLRTEEDRQALIEAVADGTIAVIATDHAPHTTEEKAAGMTEAPFGIVGLESALSVLLKYLVASSAMLLSDVLRAMTQSPARLLGIAGGTLEAGAPADLLVFDPEGERVVDPAQFESSGRNTPFAGERLPGIVKTVIIGGEIVLDGGEFAPRRPPSPGSDRYHE